VQAAIGAVPIAAGVASGEVILAVAVLSILLTAPVGAIGIMVIGERVLDCGEQSIYRFKEVRERLGLPHVGERVRNKRFDTLWKVVEEKEVWLEPPANSGLLEGRPEFVPAIHLHFLRECSNNSPQKKKSVSYRYSSQDPSFENNWEVLYDW